MAKLLGVKSKFSGLNLKTKLNYCTSEQHGVPVFHVCVVLLTLFQPLLAVHVGVSLRTQHDLKGPWGYPPDYLKSLGPETLAFLEWSP